MRKHFEGRRTRPPPLFTYPSKLTLQNVPVERFGQSNSPKLFVQFVQNRYLFRQTECPLHCVGEGIFNTQKNSPDESRSCTVFIKYRLAAMWRIKPAQSRWATARRFHAPCVRQSAHLMRREVCNPPMETESLNKSVGL